MKIKRLKCLLLSLLMTATAFAAVSCDSDEPTPLDLFVDGVSEFVIVRGADLAPSEATAVAELCKYLEKITGVVLPVVTDETRPVKNEIVVGKTNRERRGEFDREELGDDGFVIKTARGKLWLVGGEQRGTLYAVYTFLEEYLGCRFYTPTVEKIPKTDNITIPAIKENKQIPVFKYRDLTYAVARQGTFAAKLKINGTYVNLSDSYGSHYIFSPGFVHTINAVTGKRGKQPCLTDPTTLENAIAKVERLLATNPDIDVIEISQNDNSDYCTCENCNRVFEEEGSQSGAIIRFVNAVANEFAEKYPNVIFQTLAYSYSQSPPKVTKPAKNVAVRLCPIYCCYNHPIDLETYDPERYESVQTLLEGDIDITADHRTDGLMDAHNIFFMEDFKGWSEICDDITIWQYSTNCHRSQLFFPNFRTMLKNARFYADNHVVGVFDMGNGYESSDFVELRAYIMSKCLWNPYMTEEEYWSLIDDFLEGVYGPGWQEIRNYIDHTQDLVEDVCCKCLSFETEDNLRWDDFNCGYLFPAPEIEDVNPEGSYPEELNAEMIRNFEDYDWSKYWNWYGILTDEASDYLSYGTACFEKAAEMAETTAQKDMIEKASLQVGFYRSWYNSQKRKKAGEGRYLAAINMLEAYFKDHPGEFTEEEQAYYTDKIDDLAASQAYRPIKEYNRELYELFKKYNISEIREGKRLYFGPDPEEYLDFRLPPDEWL